MSPRLKPSGKVQLNRRLGLLEEKKFLEGLYLSKSFINTALLCTPRVSNRVEEVVCFSGCSHNRRPRYNVVVSRQLVEDAMMYYKIRLLLASGSCPFSNSACTFWINLITFTKEYRRVKIIKKTIWKLFFYFFAFI